MGSTFVKGMRKGAISLFAVVCREREKGWKEVREEGRKEEEKRRKEEYNFLKCNLTAS